MYIMNILSLLSYSDVCLDREFLEFVKNYNQTPVSDGIKEISNRNQETKDIDEILRVQKKKERVYYIMATITAIAGLISLLVILTIQNSFIPVEVCDEEVYMSEPDGGLIPEEQNRHKCDYLLYCNNSSQINFIELKGANISAKSGYNPYSQIIDTVKFFKEDEDLKSIVDRKMEKHAFIVSPGRQKIPRGSEIMERQLWKALMQDGTKREINEIIHYVKVTRSDRYSNNKGQIICSPGNPVKIPFQN
mgnify:CR=1 FL=1